MTSLIRDEDLRTDVRLRDGRNAGRSAKKAPARGESENFARRVIRNHHARDEQVAAYSVGWESIEWLTWGQLMEQVGALEASLWEIGLRPGHRVVAQMNNDLATLTAFLATAAVGAEWISVAPYEDLDEVLLHRDLSPRLVFCVDGHVGRDERTKVDRSRTVAHCSLLGVDVVVVPIVDPDSSVEGTIDWGDLFISRAERMWTSTPSRDRVLCSTGPGHERGPSVTTHGQAATFALHALRDDILVGHDAAVFMPATAGSVAWLRLMCILALGVTIVLGDPSHPNFTVPDLVRLS